jgi:hypothetical protein
LHKRLTLKHQLHGYFVKQLDKLYAKAARFFFFLNYAKSVAKDVQVKKVQSDQYAGVLKHGRMLALFDPVLGLVEL